MIRIIILLMNEGTAWRAQTLMQTGSLIFLSGRLSTTRFQMVMNMMVIWWLSCLCSLMPCGSTSLKTWFSRTVLEAPCTTIGILRQGISQILHTHIKTLIFSKSIIVSITIVCHHHCHNDQVGLLNPPCSSHGRLHRVQIWFCPLLCWGHR